MVLGIYTWNYSAQVYAAILPLEWHLSSLRRGIHVSLIYLRLELISSCSQVACSSRIPAIYAMPSSHICTRSGTLGCHCLIMHARKWKKDLPRTLEPRVRAAKLSWKVRAVSPQRKPSATSSLS